MSLNPPQRQAVNVLAGPLLVLAGAGTGKTRVVTMRIANLIKKGVRADRILGVTFTNKAATEMQYRLAEMLGRRRKLRPQISTFHSHCVRVLRRHARHLGLPDRFAIYGRGDQEGVARNVLNEVKSHASSLKPGDLINMIGNWKSHGVRPPEASKIAQSDAEHLGAAAFRRYQLALKAAGAVDFDDLLLLTEDLFTQFPDVRQAESGLFDHILIDEYQDTNQSQYRIVKELASPHRNLCVVGDDDQAIYAWRGAEVKHILRFKKDWPDAKVVRLEQNYRSTAEILDLANRLIAFNSQRHDKALQAARRGGPQPRIEQYKDEEQEAKAVVKGILKRISEPDREPGDFAILFRTNEQPRVFEQELRKQKVPYILIGGSSFFDRAEVKDILAYLNVVDRPHSAISLRRILNRPPRGISDQRAKQLGELSLSQGVSLWRVLKDPPSLTKAATRGVAQLTDIIDRYHRQFQAPQGSLTSILQGFINEIDYEAQMRRLYPDENERRTRWELVEQIVNAMASYEQSTKSPTLRGFLDEVTLGEQDFESGKDEQLKQNSVALITYHSAKGLEYPEVYMVGMEMGLLPHKRSVVESDLAVEEERRLCYVGVTRAQDRLTLTMALTRMKWGKPRESIASQFLYEMIGQAENARAAQQRCRQELLGEAQAKKKRIDRAEQRARASAKKPKASKP